MKTDNRQQILLMVTIAVVALFAADKLVVGPLSNGWHQRAKEVGSLRAKVAEGKAMLRRETAIRSHWEQMQTNTLPNNPSLASEQMLRAVQDWAQESGASLNAVTPQWKNDTEDHQTLSCRVDASGSMWTLSRFLYDVEKGPMGFKVESLDLSSRDNAGQQLTLILQLSGLVLTPQSK